MIRRQVGAESFWLITQHDHAQVSGQLARHLGNASFAPPSSESAMLGIALHDCGWPIHDDRPTLNTNHQPLDVFETPRELGLEVWDASAIRATQRDDYAGLLVSLHGLALSVFATSQSPVVSGSPWNMNDTRARFELNRFQHKMIELQESLRQRLGLRTDRPLKHGLAEEAGDAKEQRLTFDFRLLQAMDRLSLSICCTHPPFAAIEPLIPRPGEAAQSIRVARPRSDLLHLHPWIFASDEVRIDLPYRQLRTQQCQDLASFRAAYAAAPVQQFTVAIRPHTM
jgi:hypothetical protein